MLLNKKIDGKKYLTPLLGLLFFLLGLGLFYYFMIYNDRLKLKNKPFVSNVSSDLNNSTTYNSSSSKEDNKPLNPNFDYIVKELKDEVIVVSGDRGDMYIPKDLSKVQVYAGLSKESAKMPLDKLKVGDRVKLEIIPGEEVLVFVYQF